MNSSVFVVDASVIVKWLNQDREQHTDQAFDILRKAAGGLHRLITSDLAVYEVLNALIRGKGLMGAVLEEAATSLFDLPVFFIRTTPNLAAAAVVIAEETRGTFYDAVYVALSYDQDAVLVTANPKHQSSIGRVQVLALESWR